MKAIRTRYLGATEKLPARLVADDGDGNRIVVPADDGKYGQVDPHARAAFALCTKMGWEDEGLVHGYHQATGSHFFTFVSPTNTYTRPGPVCPDCGAALTARVERDGQPVYCEACDRETPEKVS